VNPPPSRLRRALLALGIVLSAAALAGIVAAWWFRDLPRRQLERALAGRLEADVHLGAFEIDGLRRFVLRDLRLRRIAGRPLVEEVAIERLNAEGDAREILAGRFVSLGLDGVEVRLSRPEEPAREPSGPAAEIFVGRLALTRGRLIIGESVVAFEADAREVGGSAEGTLTARADRWFLAPLLPRQGHLDGLDLRATLAADGTIRATLSTGEGALVEGERTIAIPPATLEATARRQDGTLSFDALLESPLFALASARGAWNLSLGALDALLARVEGARLSALAPFLPALPEGTAVEGRADLTVALREEETLAWDLSLGRSRIELPGSVAAEVSEVNASGTFPMSDPAALGPVRFALRVEQAWGAWNGFAVPSGLLPLTVAFDGTASARPATRASGALRLAAPAVGVCDASASIDFAASTVDAGWRWSGATVPALESVVRDATGSAFPAGVALHGRIDAEGTAKGPLLSPAIAAKTVVRGLQGATEVEGFGRVALTDGELVAHLATASVGEPVAISSLTVRGTARAGGLDPIPLAIDAAGRWLPSPMGVDLARAAIAVGDLGRLEAEGRWRSDASPRASGTVRLGAVDLARIRSLLRPWIGDPVPGFTVKGMAEGTATGSLTASGSWSAEGTAAIRGSGFASEDGAKVLEGFDSTWDLDFEGTSGGEARVRGTAEVGGFVALWDTFFADYSGLPSSVELRGSFRPAREEVAPAWGGTLDWIWPEGGTVSCALSSRTDGALGYSLSLRVDDLRSSLDRYLRGPLGDAVPWFERIEGSGAIDARVSGTVSDEATTARGRIRLDGVGLAGTKGLVEVEGLDLDLPFDLAFAETIGGGKENGSLAFERVHLSGLTLDALRTGLAIEADSVALEEPLAVPMLGGGLGFERLRLADALRPSRRLVTSMLVHAIDLAEISKAFGLPPLEGTADGYFPRIELTGPTLKVDGGGGVDLFGGRIDIGEISGEDLLSRFPKIDLSLEFRGIDLERVTRVFDFGSMTGVLDGYARNVELFRGVPTRFDARIESAERGRERIDVKAINNIAILGTGGKVSAFDRGIHKFLDTFYYEKLGITLQLVNDVFLMRGLEERGGKELFLKGALPFRIDIVNVKPGQTTSFRSMLERMKAVDFEVGGSGS
jgi:hypothetical protein